LQNTGADAVQGTAQDVNQAVKLELTESVTTNPTSAGRPAAPLNPLEEEISRLQRWTSNISKTNNLYLVLLKVRINPGIN